jgi:hypothetical protein
MTAKERIKRETLGFITTKADLDLIISESPTEKILVRCGGGRFLAPANQAQHFIDIIENEGSDYVRDISFQAC